MLFGTIVVGLCVALLYHQMHLTSLMKHINESELALEELKSEYPAQVEYIEMTSPEVTEVSKSNATLGDAVANLMRSFTAVLEYLR